MNNKIKNIVIGSILSAMYIVLTLVASAFGLSSGVIQVRISESLCIFPLYTMSAIPGLFIGCLISNLILGSTMIDIIFGSIATLIGAILTYAFRKHKNLALIFPVLSNSLIVPLILKYGYGLSFVYKEVDLSYLYFMITVFVGEFISIYIIGYFVKKVSDKYLLKILS